jgi:hypothetical protein
LHPVVFFCVFLSFLWSCFGARKTGTESRGQGGNPNCLGSPFGRLFWGPFSGHQIVAPLLATSFCSRVGPISGPQNVRFFCGPVCVDSYSPKVGYLFGSSVAFRRRWLLGPRQLCGDACGWARGCTAVGRVLQKKRCVGSRNAQARSRFGVGGLTVCLERVHLGLVGRVSHLSSVAPRLLV